MGTAKDAIVAEAPGRVNLIGEHTDYNGGWVLPAPIPRVTRVELRPRPDGTVRAVSTRYPGAQPLEYRLGEEAPAPDWLNYVRGVTWLLRREGLSFGGFDLRIDSHVPVGSGLSSSATLEVSLLRALRRAYALPLDDVAIARLGQRVENEFVGARVGIMDQMASSVGLPGTALFLDCQELTYEQIPLPLDRVELGVIHSGISHSNAGGEYNTRRAQCEEACRLLSIRSLREATVEDLPRARALLPEPLLRRARHVITENARVHAAVAALRSGDAAALGRLFDESHRSMRDDYEITVPEIDLLVSLAAREPATFGARMTGGGFGGSIVLACRPGTARQTSLRVLRAYEEATGRHGQALVA